MTVTLDAALHRKSNAFDIVRLIAASLVIASHSYPLLGREDELFARLFVYDTGGGFAVAAFFVISGFLISRSAVENDGTSFLLARFLRLAPALAFVALCQYLILGPLFTTLPIGTFFNIEKWHIVKTISLYENTYMMTGVFANNPHPEVNGSLWTLNYEWAFYLIIFLLITLKIISKKTIAGLFIAFLAAFTAIKLTFGLHFGNPGGFLFIHSPLYGGLKSFAFFLIGSLFYFHRQTIILSWPLAIASAIILIISAESHFSTFAYHLAFPYLVIFFGLYFQPRIDLKKKIGDLSYGVYLFGFPVQQACVALLAPHLSPTRLTILALAISLICAWISWHLIERPALGLRHRFRTRGR